MGTLTKLTRAQALLLVDISEQPTFCADGYRPAQKLVELGMATWSPGGILAITEAGRKALEDS